MIESVNSLTAPTHSTAGANTPGGVADEGTEDPLSQIGAVLSAHLKSLQWISSTVQDVESKVGEAEAKVREASGGGKGGRTVAHGNNRSLGGYGSGSMTSSFGSGGREGSLTGSGAPLAGFGNMSLRGSEGPRARGFGLGSSTYRA